MEAKAKALKAAGFAILSGSRKTADGYYEFETLYTEDKRLQITAKL